MTMPKSIYRLQKIKIQSSKKLSEKLGVVQQIQNETKWIEMLKIEKSNKLELKV